MRSPRPAPWILLLIALATLAGELLTLRSEVVSVDGSRYVSGRRSGPASDPEALGRALAGELIAGGAAEILAAIRRAGDAKP